MSAFQSGAIDLTHGQRQRIPTIRDPLADAQCRGILAAAETLRSCAGVGDSAHVSIHDTRLAGAAAAMDGAVRLDIPARRSSNGVGFTSVTIGGVVFFASEVLP